MSAPPPDSDPAPDQLDPLYLHARREALLILALWAICLVWTVGCSYLMGYGTGSETVSTIAGIPSWVVWGVGAPWLVATGITFWFCFAYMADDDLGDVPGTPEEPADE